MKKIFVLFVLLMSNSTAQAITSFYELPGQENNKEKICSTKMEWVNTHSKLNNISIELSIRKFNNLIDSSELKTLDPTTCVVVGDNNYRTVDLSEF